MNIFIDNKNLKTFYGIECLDFSDAFSIASERTNERTWSDKSGIDKNLSNIRYDSREFVLSCYCKANSIISAYNIANTLISYIFSKGNFVLSFRDPVTNEKFALLCERSGLLTPDVHIRQQNSIYAFKLNLKDVNPNSLKIQSTITYNSGTGKYVSSFIYDKGRPAIVYWGNGDRSEVSNSGTYSHEDYTATGVVDIIVDIDKDLSTVTPLTSNFSADITSGIKDLEVQFTDLSTGSISIWSWDFGDGYTSSEQNPAHTYLQPGFYDVTLSVFNSENGSSVNKKDQYITVRAARLLINSTNSFKINSTNKLLKN